MMMCNSVIAFYSLNYLFCSLDYLFYSLNLQHFQRHYLTSSQSDEAVDHYQQNCMIMINFKVAIHSLTVYISIKTD